MWGYALSSALYGDIGYLRRHVKCVTWRPQSASSKSREMTSRPTPPPKNENRPHSARSYITKAQRTHGRGNASFIGRRYVASQAAAIRREKGRRSFLELQKKDIRRVKGYTSERKSKQANEYRHHQTLNERNWSLGSLASVESLKDTPENEEMIHLDTCIQDDESLRGDHPVVELKEYFAANRTEIQSHRVGFSRTLHQSPPRLNRSIRFNGRVHKMQSNGPGFTALVTEQLQSDLDYKSFCMKKRSTFAVVPRFR